MKFRDTPGLMRRRGRKVQPSVVSSTLVKALGGATIPTGISNCLLCRQRHRNISHQDIGVAFETSPFIRVYETRCCDFSASRALGAPELHRGLKDHLRL